MTTMQDQIPVVVLDTDIASSTDDLVAMTFLYHFADMGRIKFSAVMIDRNGEENAKIADIMNTYYNHPEVEIGVTTHGPENPVIWIDYWKMCEQKRENGELLFSRTLSDMEIRNLPDAVQLYRKILSRSDDGAVIVFSIGFANNLARLLESQPDEYSSLNGIELVRTKVKGIYIQAGHYGEAMEPDFNFKSDPKHAMILMDKCPVPMYFSPQEAGDNFIYNSEQVLADLEATEMTDSPLYHCYKYHNCETGQCMWDTMPLLGWLHPEYFDTYGPLDISLSDDMILVNKQPSASSNRYVQFPDLKAKDNIMKLIRRYSTKCGVK
ncbi:MAG: hypothetical protein ACI4V5_08335 [Prevotella sp.]